MQYVRSGRRGSWYCSRRRNTTWLSLSCGFRIGDSIVSHQYLIIWEMREELEENGNSPKSKLLLKSILVNSDPEKYWFLIFAWSNNRRNSKNQAWELIGNPWQRTFEFLVLDQPLDVELDDNSTVIMINNEINILTIKFPCEHYTCDIKQT